MIFYTRNFDCKVPRNFLACGILLVFLYSFFRIFYPPVGSFSETAFAITGLFSLLYFSKFLRFSFPVFLLFLALLSQTLSWVVNYIENPDWVADNPQIDRLAKIFIFISVAWWLRGSANKVIFSWFLGLLGAVVGIWSQSDGVSEWLLGLEGVRVNLGVRNWQHSAMLLGVCFIGLSVFFPRIIATEKYRTLKCLFWVGGLLYCLIGLYITQTRAVFVGLLLGFLTFFFVFFFATEFKSILFRPLRNRIILMFSLIIGISLLFLYSAGGRILIEFSYILPKIFDLQFPLPDTSLGVRINTWVAAFPWISEKPFFGWGGSARGLVIDHTPWLSEWTKENIGHLHNYALEVLVSYGVFGLSIISALYAWFVFVVYKSWRKRYISGDIAAFGLIFLVYWIFINQFESYLSFWTGVYVHNLIFGGFVSIYWLGCLGERIDSSEK
ncbi:O-antigen ligase family protein [Halomonas sp. H33-56]|uniref:O-antigen ligase family protein n=1 Tax=Halomonas sp. H33-56 TaxID=2950873 RepID=UPI0032DF2F07